MTVNIRPWRTGLVDRLRLYRWPQPLRRLAISKLIPKRSGAYFQFTVDLRGHVYRGNADNFMDYKVLADGVFERGLVALMIRIAEAVGGLGGSANHTTPGPGLAGDGAGGSAGSSVSYANTSVQPTSAERGGGGGAAGSSGIGGNSVWGGGGGVWNASANGGRSVFGGDGGDSGALAQVPGGGGSGGLKGADGWIRIWAI